MSKIMSTEENPEYLEVINSSPPRFKGVPKVHE